jgi:hypothetical protein
MAMALDRLRQRLPFLEHHLEEIEALVHGTSQEYAQTVPRGTTGSR